MSVTPKTAAKLLAWDSEFWGLKIAQAAHPDVDQWAFENTVGCISLLVGTDESERVQEAEAHGFRFMDVRVTLESTQGAARSYGRAVEDADLEPLAALARRSHRITRFYADPCFDEERCDDLYEGWIRNSISGWADSVRVVGPVGMPVGYVTVHVDGETSSLGLIAVDERARGQGYGLHLVRAALWEAWNLGAPRMTVVTQGRNVTALRLFERAGFRTCATHLWLHKWYR